MVKSSNYQIGRSFEGVAKKHFEQFYQCEFKSEKIKSGLNGGKLRQFDLVNFDKKILIECKNFKFTEGNNVPSAKIAEFLKEVYKLYIAPKEYKKIICISKSVNQKGISLKDYIVDKYYDFIPTEIEIIEL